MRVKSNKALRRSARLARQASTSAVAALPAHASILGRPGLRVGAGSIAAAVAGILWGTGGAAYAQEPVPAGGEPAEALQEVVVTASATGVKKLDASYNIVAVDAEQIKEANPKSTADILKVSPGIWPESSGGQTGANIEIAGIPGGGDAPYFTNMIEGMPLYGMPSLSFMDSSSLFRLDNTIQRVEVVQGGPGAVFGPGQRRGGGHVRQRALDQGRRLLWLPGHTRVARECRRLLPLIRWGPLTAIQGGRGRSDHRDPDPRSRWGVAHVLGPGTGRQESVHRTGPSDSVWQRQFRRLSGLRPAHWLLRKPRHPARDDPESGRRFRGCRSRQRARRRAVLLRHQVEPEIRRLVGAQQLPVRRRAPQHQCPVLGPEPAALELLPVRLSGAAAGGLLWTGHCQRALLPERGDRSQQPRGRWTGSAARNQRPVSLCRRWCRGGGGPERDPAGLVVHPEAAPKLRR